MNEPMATVFRLTDLLKEWLDTPFFERREDWQRWADDFRPRVAEAVKHTEQHWCRSCGGCRISLYCCYHTCECEHHCEACEAKAGLTHD